MLGSFRQSEVVVGKGFWSHGPGAAGAVTGLDLSFFFSNSLSFILSFISQQGRRVVGGGGALPSRRLTQRRRGLSRSCYALLGVNTV